MGRRYQLRHPWKALHDGQYWDRQDWECESAWHYPPHSYSDRPQPPLGKVQIGDAITSLYRDGESWEERQERFGSAARAMMRSVKWRDSPPGMFGERPLTNFEMLLTKKEIDMGFKVMQVVGAGEHLKASDVDRPKLLTIRDVTQKHFEGETRPKAILHFNECEQTLVLNVTNTETIVEMVGNDDSDQWVGVQVVLFKDKTDFQGRRTDCIRVRAPKATTAAKAASTQQQIQPEEMDDIPF